MPESGRKPENLWVRSDLPSGIRTSQERHLNKLGPIDMSDWNQLGIQRPTPELILQRLTTTLRFFETKGTFTPSPPVTRMSCPRVESS